MRDEDIITRAQEYVKKAINTLQAIQDDYVFRDLQSEYETLADINTDFQNVINGLRAGEYNFNG